MTATFCCATATTWRRETRRLTLKPLLHFPGPLLWMEMDPAQQFLVTDSHEPEAASSDPGQVPSPSTAAASVTHGW